MSQTKYPKKTRALFPASLRSLKWTQAYRLEAVNGLIRAYERIVEPAGVMEALYIGVHFPDVVKQLKGILAPMSIGSPNGMDRFCPYLFQFGSEVSIGIELLESSLELPFVPLGSKVLALRSFTS